MANEIKSELQHIKIETPVSNREPSLDVPISPGKTFDINTPNSDSVLGEKYPKALDKNGRLLDREVKLGETTNKAPADTTSAELKMMAEIIENGADPSTIENLPPEKIMEAILGKIADHQGSKE